MAQSEISTIFLAKDVDRRLLIITSEQDIWEFTGLDWEDRTGTDVVDGWGERWTGGWLTGALTLANRKVVRTFQPGVDAVTQPMVYNGGVGQPGDQTWESLEYSARVFRPFREYMLAGYPQWGDDPFPTRIQWSHAVEPGLVPEDWVPRADNQAGDVDLADTPGAVVDMLPLRDYLLVLKEDAIHLCSFVGGNQVFAFRRITTNKGVNTRDCAVEYNGRVFVQGADDIFVLDGNAATSILWGRVKNAWLADRDPDRGVFSFTALDPIHEEVCFFYVSKNAPPIYLYPDKVLVYSLRTNAFFFRDYQLEVPHARVSLSVENQGSTELVFYGIDRGGARILDLEASPDRLGSPVPAYFIRSGLFAEPGHDWVQVDQSKLHLSGNSASLQLGGQNALGAAIDWRSAVSFDPTSDYKIDARHNANLIAVRVDVSTLTDWQMSSLNLLLQKSGER